MSLRFSLFNVALIQFQPSLERVRIHICYTSEFHSPARLCSISVASTWALLVGHRRGRGAEWIMEREKGDPGCLILQFFFPFHVNLSFRVSTSLSSKLSHLQLLSQFLLTPPLLPAFSGRSPYALAFSFKRHFTTFSLICDRIMGPFKPDTQV